MDRDLGKVLKKFGSRIKKLREAQRITQDELAERCNVSQKFVSQLERGANTPSFETIVAIAHRGFGVTVSELVRGIDPQQPNPTSEIDRLMAEAPPSAKAAFVRILRILVETMQ